ncbi:hypothetical protein PT285_11100 [Lactobacillus sp. ESL0791]|uniref:hypothetical protein n=1 Tax=Lactobacillus sp. ESL0791 TaxID=2983234 RepID=UPI0023F9B30B|nr:hypothetical protein [Lactobacillus sp. ESL0791]MDF7639948.1 hypothetical protein [Lactobacillus sp. ESL0791]
MKTVHGLTIGMYWLTRYVLADKVINKGQVESDDGTDYYSQHGAGSDWLNRQKANTGKQQVRANPNHYASGGYESKWEKEAKADYQKRLHDAEAKIDNSSANKETTKPNHKQLSEEERDSAIAAAKTILAEYTD